MNIRVGLHVKQLLFLSDFDEKCMFLINIRRTLKHGISWKSNQVTAEWHHADGQTDTHDVANIHFHILQNHQKWQPN